MGPLRSETTSARSSRPGFLMPQWMPAAQNPCGAVIPRRGDAVGPFLVIFVNETSYSMWSSRPLKKSASAVLASSRPSTGTGPPPHSAARTDLVSLIRRTMRPRGYASSLHSLRPCSTAFLNSLRAQLELSMTCSNPVLPRIHGSFSTPFRDRQREPSSLSPQGGPA